VLEDLDADLRRSLAVRRRQAGARKAATIDDLTWVGDQWREGSSQIEIASLAGCSVARYDLNLWIGHPLEGAAYLPR
jgi:hypothetical protein